MAKAVYLGKDRRRSVRFRFDASVTVEHEGGCFEARGTDFNDDAIGIVRQEALPIGTTVQLTVVDEMNNEVKLDGEVARADPAEDGEGFAMVIQRTATDDHE